MLEPFGRDMAKIRLDAMSAFEDGGATRARLVAVTAMSPTPHGEGKTVTAIGLVDALNRTGKVAIGTLRQPSLGPIFGLKGGATGGGLAQLVPSDDINLHFTGDFHAVAAAQNLLAAMVDNHVFHGNRLRLDPARIYCNRTIDVEDRALRHVMLGVGQNRDAGVREAAFDIVAACETMAVLAQSSGRDDLKRRLSRMVVGRSREGRLVTAAELAAEGAMAALLRHALEPNLVQTLEGNPVLVHAGPFANVAPGNSSVIADRIALGRADYVVTEAGFGTDCGFEKLVDVKCRTAGYLPDMAVLVVTVRALRWHGSNGDDEGGAEAIRRGCANMVKHAENIAAFGCPCIIALNVFEGDTEQDLAIVEEEAARIGLPIARSRAFSDGGAGTHELAEAVLDVPPGSSLTRPLYPLDWELRKKIVTVATRIYGADSVTFSEAANRDLDRYETHGFGDLPICIAKTSSSLSHDSKLRNRPTGFVFPIEAVRLYAGAGYVMPLAGPILTMPGLPREPRAEAISVDRDGSVRGL
jgi:formate--tetrahydrofolate ligase